MSKAFAANDSEDDSSTLPRKAPVLPPGAKNYMTPAGAAKLEQERLKLTRDRAALGDSVENAERRKALDRHLAFLSERLNLAEVIDPRAQPAGKVLFGATVMLEDSSGTQQRWRIVGVDEADPSNGSVSWISPLARALMDKAIGDEVRISDQRLVVRAIRYDD
jgi:transcription elongation factor GreB